VEESEESVETFPSRVRIFKEEIAVVKVRQMVGAHERSYGKRRITGGAYPAVIVKRGYAWRVAGTRAR
jgi:hypothetical protein